MPERQKIGKPFLKFGFVLLAGAALMSCNRSRTSQENTPVDATAPKEPTVIIDRGSGSSVRVKVELARTPEKREMGLMYRDKLEKGTGMLFIFEEESVQSFWMKNTLMPLDMIFINRDLEIAGIVENAEPLTLSPRKVDALSQFVLEVEGGFCGKYGISKGMQVEFSGFNP
jgi:uncharacterized membrane protein (UPF0127 family)